MASFRGHTTTTTITHRGEHMDLGVFVKRAESGNNAPVLDQILAGSLASDLVCIFDDTLNTAHALLAHMRSCCPQFMMYRSLREVETCRPFPETPTFVLLEDCTIELFDAARLTNVLQQVVRMARCKNVTLVLTAQMDILTTSTCEAVRFLADTCITVLSPDPSSSKVRLSVIHRLPGGQARNEVCVLGDGHIMRVEDQTSATASTPALPTSTFNLDISEEQLAAKANVLLPHLRVQMEQPAVRPPERRRILADDYDEEDPDDDLDL